MVLDQCQMCGVNGKGFWGRCWEVHLLLSLTVMIRQRPPVGNMPRPQWNLHCWNNSSEAFSHLSHLLEIVV